MEKVESLRREGGAKKIMNQPLLQHTQIVPAWLVERCKKVDGQCVDGSRVFVLVVGIWKILRCLVSAHPKKIFGDSGTKQKIEKSTENRWNPIRAVRQKYWQVTGYSRRREARNRLTFVHGRIRWEKKTFRELSSFERRGG